MTNTQTVDKDKRWGWLRDLKVGDKVYVGYSGTWSTALSVKTVDRITPTGRLTVEGATFSYQGQAAGSRYYLSQWTQEKEDAKAQAKHRDRVLYQVDGVKWDSVPTEVIEQVIELSKIRES